MKDVAFSRSLGLEIGDLVKGSWVYKRLRHLLKRRNCAFWTGTS